MAYVLRGNCEGFSRNPPEHTSGRALAFGTFKLCSKALHAQKENAGLPRVLCELLVNRTGPRLKYRIRKRNEKFQEVSNVLAH